MLIVYRVPHGTAVAAVVIYEAVGLLIPLFGGAVAYLLLKRSFGAAAKPAQGTECGSLGATDTE